MCFLCPNSKRNASLYTNDYRNSHLEMETLVGDSLGSAVIDCGATKTIFTWYNCYLDTLSEMQKKSIQTEESNTSFKFGDNPTVEAIKKVKIPTIIGKTSVLLETHIVEADVPFLLSKEALKKANAFINFENDTISIFGETQNLFLTTSGQYALPIDFQCGQLLSELGENQATESVFITTELCDKNKIASKLHRQFSHLKAERLIDLLKSSGNTDETLFQAIKELDISFEICKRYRRPSPEPVVELPMAKSFNECVAMDLKEFREHVRILHFIDHATRFSAGAVIYSKRKEVIVEEIFNSWIGIFGPPSKFLSDNGGEFANQDLLDLCEKMNIVVKTTAAESPWGNGLVERHNALISETVLAQVRTLAQVVTSSCLDWPM